MIQHDGSVVGPTLFPCCASCRIFASPNQTAIVMMIISDRTICVFGIPDVFAERLRRIPHPPPISPNFTSNRSSTVLPSKPSTSLCGRFSLYKKNQPGKRRLNPRLGQKEVRKNSDVVLPFGGFSLSFLICNIVVYRLSVNILKKKISTFYYVIVSYKKKVGIFSKLNYTDLRILQSIAH